MEWSKTIALSELDKLRLESALDQSLRQRLVENPEAVLAERGIEVPEGVFVNIVEDTENTHTITLPAFVGADLSTENISGPMGGAASTWECTTCTPTSPIAAGSLASLICLGNK
ncbi:MAG: hypothetical protein AB1589_16480 [Cyanobacteriota bacterium]